MFYCCLLGVQMSQECQDETSKRVSCIDDNRDDIVWFKVYDNKTHVFAKISLTP